MKLNEANVTATVAVVMMLIATATDIYQLGQLSNQVDNLSVQIEDLREEMRRSNQQLLHSLANHTHDENGNAVFTVPPGADPTGANQNAGPQTQ